MKALVSLFVVTLVLATAPAASAQDPKQKAKVEAALEVASTYIDGILTRRPGTAAALVSEKHLEEFHEEAIAFAKIDGEHEEELSYTLLDGFSEGLEGAETPEELLELLEPYGIGADAFAKIEDGQAQDIAELLEALAPRQVFALYVGTWTDYTPERILATATRSELISSAEEETKSGKVLHLTLRVAVEAEVELHPALWVFSLIEEEGSWRVIPDGYDLNFFRELKANLAEPIE